MSSSKDFFIMRCNYRKVLVFRDQCPHYPDVLAFARSTFRSLQDTDDKDIVIMGSGRDWEGSVELSERAWEAFCTNLSDVYVGLRQENET